MTYDISSSIDPSVVVILRLWQSLDRRNQRFISFWAWSRNPVSDDSVIEPFYQGMPIGIEPDPFEFAVSILLFESASDDFSDGLSGAVI